MRKNRKKVNKSNKIYNMHVLDSAGQGNLCEYNSERQSMSSLNLDSIMEELYGHIHRKSFTYGSHDHHGEINVQPEPVEKYPASEEKLSEATKVFINQKFPTRTTEEFTDALQALNSNKELFLKLLQDPNSLLMKHIKKLLDT